MNRGVEQMEETLTRPGAGMINSGVSEGERGAWRLSREQVMEQILSINPSAGRRFLEQFGQDRLGDYLERLIRVRSPRGAESRFVRRGDTPAIVGGARGRRR
ncbi:MAG: hypothetical protein ACIARR_04220 [Phycisphaerales bacterium JB059]